MNTELIQRPMNPQQYFKKIQELKRLTENLREENARLRHKLQKFMKVEATEMETDLDTVKAVINQFFSVDIDIRTRQNSYVVARRVYYVWCRKNTALSLKAIAQSLNTSYDHTTLLAAFQAHQDIMETDKRYKEQIEKVNKYIEIALSEKKL